MENQAINFNKDIKAFSKFMGVDEERLHKVIVDSKPKDQYNSADARIKLDNIFNGNHEEKDAAREVLYNICYKEILKGKTIAELRYSYNNAERDNRPSEIAFITWMPLIKTIPEIIEFYVLFTDVFDVSEKNRENAPEEFKDFVIMDPKKIVLKKLDDAITTFPDVELALSEFQRYFSFPSDWPYNCQLKEIILLKAILLYRTRDDIDTTQELWIGCTDEQHKTIDSLRLKFFKVEIESAKTAYQVMNAIQRKSISGYDKGLIAEAYEKLDKLAGKQSRAAKSFKSVFAAFKYFADETENAKTSAKKLLSYAKTINNYKDIYYALIPLRNCVEEMKTAYDKCEAICREELEKVDTAEKARDIGKQCIAGSDTQEEAFLKAFMFFEES